MFRAPAVRPGRSPPGAGGRPLQRLRGDLRLRAGAAEVVEHIETGCLTMDGGRLVPLVGESIQARRHMLFNGAASVTVVLDKAGKLRADPQVSFRVSPKVPIPTSLPWTPPTRFAKPWVGCRWPTGATTPRSGRPPGAWSGGWCGRNTASAR